ncbi:hypothetical protein Tco_1272065, partial [Tanacetum coccineum]
MQFAPIISLGIASVDLGVPDVSAKPSKRICVCGVIHYNNRPFPGELSGLSLATCRWGKVSLAICRWGMLAREAS